MAHETSIVYISKSQRSSSFYTCVQTIVCLFQNLIMQLAQ